MNEKSRQNLGEVLARMGDPRRAADGLRTDRDRICRIVRVARLRVRANKEKNGARLGVKDRTTIWSMLKNGNLAKIQQDLGDGGWWCESSVDGEHLLDGDAFGAQ